MVLEKITRPSANNLGLFVATDWATCGCQGMQGGGATPFFFYIELALLLWTKKLISQISACFKQGKPSCARFKQGKLSSLACLGLARARAGFARASPALLLPTRNLCIAGQACSSSPPRGGGARQEHASICTEPVRLCLRGG